MKRGKQKQGTDTTCFAGQRVSNFGMTSGSETHLQHSQLKFKKMGKTNQKEQLFFIFKQHTLSSKNKLQHDVLQLVVAKYDRQLVFGQHIDRLFKDFKKDVEQLQAKYPRCKPLDITYSKSDSYDKDACIYDSDLFTLKLYRANTNIELWNSKEMVADNEKTLTETIRKHAL